MLKLEILMFKRVRTKVASLLCAAVLAACGVKAQAISVPGDTKKPVIIMVGGLGETRGHSRLDPLRQVLLDRGYRVFWYAENDAILWPTDCPVIGIGYSYGGDTLCRVSRSGFRIDRLILLNPVKQGAWWEQGRPLHVGRVGTCEVYATPDAFPRASTYVIDSAGNKYSAILYQYENHWSLPAAAVQKIVNSF